MKKLALIFLISIALIVGCIAGEQIKQVEEGMAVTDVKQIMGKPDGFKRIENFKLLTYTNRYMSGWSHDKADYYFIFKDDRLTEWGTGEVRPQRNNYGVLFFVPITY